MSRSQQDTFIDDSEECCPLCVEEFDLSDRNFKPCPCGYQICQFCFNNIRSNLNGLCPACRRPYSDDTIEYKAVSAEDVKAEQQKKARVHSERRQREAQKREIEAQNRKHLAGLRVVQKNLVYVTGLSPGIKEEELLETLRGETYFGQYGKIAKIVVNKRTAHDPYSGDKAGGIGVYVTYHRKQDAAMCIAAVDGSQNGDRVLRATYGTTKYCSSYLRGEQCPNRNCMFLHEPGEEADSFSRLDLSSINAGQRTVGNQPGGQHSLPPHRPVATAQHPPPPIHRTGSAMHSRQSDDHESSALPPTVSWASKNPSTPSVKPAQLAGVQGINHTATPSPKTASVMPLKRGDIQRAPSTSIPDPTPQEAAEAMAQAQARATPVVQKKKPRNATPAPEQQKTPPPSAPSATSAASAASAASTAPAAPATPAATAPVSQPPREPTPKAEPKPEPKPEPEPSPLVEERVPTPEPPREPTPPPVVEEIPLDLQLMAQLVTSLKDKTLKFMFSAKSVATDEDFESYKAIPPLFDPAGGKRRHMIMDQRAAEIERMRKEEEATLQRASAERLEMQQQAAQEVQLQQQQAAELAHNGPSSPPRQATPQQQQAPIGTANLQHQQQQAQQGQTTQQQLHQQQQSQQQAHQAQHQQHQQQQQQQRQLAAQQQQLQSILKSGSSSNQLPHAPFQQQEAITLLQQQNNLRTQTPTNQLTASLLGVTNAQQYNLFLGQAGQQSANQHMQHQRRDSRYTFSSNDNLGSAIKATANAQHMAQQQQMMTQQQQQVAQQAVPAQFYNQLSAQNMQAPPGLKTSTPPAGLGLFGNQSNFAGNVGGLAGHIAGGKLDAGNELLQQLMGRRDNKYPSDPSILQARMTLPQHQGHHQLHQQQIVANAQSQQGGYNNPNMYYGGSGRW